MNRGRRRCSALRVMPPVRSGLLLFSLFLPALGFALRLALFLRRLGRWRRRTRLGTGYRGRTAVHEVMRISEALRIMVLERRSSEAIGALAVSQGMLTLHNSAVRKVLMGLTTPEEVLRVAHSEDTESEQ